MNEILSYAAPVAPSRFAMTFGILSTTFAASVFALPITITGVAQFFQHVFAHSGARVTPLADLCVHFFPTMPMVLIPLTGLLCGMLSVSEKPANRPWATFGMVVNTSGFLAAVLAVAQ